MGHLCPTNLPPLGSFFPSCFWASIWSCIPCNRPSNCWPHSVAWLVHHCLPLMTASQTLVLDRRKPLPRSGPGAVCKVVWMALAAKWLKDRQAILHMAAKSYASKISGVLHDGVVHKTKRMRRTMYVCRRASKVGGLWYIFIAIYMFKLVTLCVYSWKNVEDYQILHIALVGILLFFPPAFSMITSHTLKIMHPTKKHIYIYIYLFTLHETRISPTSQHFWDDDFVSSLDGITYIYLSC